MPKVLLIEDSLSQRLYFKSIFKRPNRYDLEFDVLEAKDGEQGLLIAQQERPDAILCDINMPVMDGYQFLSKLRSQPALYDIPVVMITGMSSRDSMRRAMGIGADDYLTKPFTDHEMVEAIVGQIQKRQRQKAQTKKNLDTLRNSVLMAIPHELRTPLTSIVTGSELLITRHNRIPDEKKLQVLENIHRGGKRLMKTITRYLELVDIRSHDVSNLRESFELNQGWLEMILKDPVGGEIMVDNNQDSQPYMERLVLDVQPVHLNLHQADLIRVIYELVGNALRFSVPDSRINIFGLFQGDKYVFQVQSQGEALPTNFKELSGDFMQFGRDQKEQQGLGLGLSISTALMERNGVEVRWPQTDGQPNIVELALA